MFHSISTVKVIKKYLTMFFSIAGLFETSINDTRITNDNYEVCVKIVILHKNFVWENQYYENLLWRSYTHFYVRIGFTYKNKENEEGIGSIRSFLIFLSVCHFELNFNHFYLNLYYLFFFFCLIRVRIYVKEKIHEKLEML